jgi:hypothetical protein
MNGPVVRDLDEVEEQILKDYEILINALDKMKSVYEPNEDVEIRGSYEIENLGKDEKKAASTISEVTDMLLQISSNLEQSQRKTKAAICSINESLVSLPASNLNESVYKQNILENIQKNLEALLK